MRRLLLFLVTLLVVAIPLPASASAPIDTSARDAAATSTTVDPTDDTTSTTIDNDFLDTERNLTECLNNSVQLPGCGSEPTDDGDRGGALQLVTFGVLTLGIAFICWRVARGIKARDAAIAAKTR